MDAKVSDFGESRQMGAAISLSTENGTVKKFRPATTATIVGTANYVDPRVARGEAYEELCDVFSFSIILFEALCAKVGVCVCFVFTLSLRTNSKRFIAANLRGPQ